MSEPKQPPKLLLHKPKKSQRTASDPPSKGDGTGGARSVSTASSNSTPPSQVKPSLWQRFRVPLTTLLVVNVVVVGYTIFRTTVKPPQIPEEAQSVERTEKERDEKKPKEETATERAQDATKALVDIGTKKESDEKKPIKAEIEKGKAEEAHAKGDLPEPPKAPQAISIQEVSKQKISTEEQQELYKWLLAEKRKVKPADKAEKAQIDAEKALLKDFLKGKSNLNV